MAAYTLEIVGKLTEGYYNAMEAGHPVFINGEAIDDVIKEKLADHNLPNEFCGGDSYEDEELEKNFLIGKTVRIIIEIMDY